MKIPVVKPFLPPLEDLMAILKPSWDAKWVTNNGPLAVKLEKQLTEYLGVKHLLYCTNGTIVLQIALEVLGIKPGDEVITTPYSYVATSSSILWQHAVPVFVDIDPETCGIDPNLIESAITSKTKAIMPVHVYGIPNDVEKIGEIAKKHDLKVIYDAAHAFGVKYKGQSILNYGDVSTLSFHATKLFHTVEGGAMISNNKELVEKLKLAKSFGHVGDDHYALGINGKQSEMHAAVGIWQMENVKQIMQKRKELCDAYDEALLPLESITRPKIPADTEYNYPYYPIFLPDEATSTGLQQYLDEQGIWARRYFYPSLNTLDYLPENVKTSCPVSENMASRALCLPLFHEMTDEEQQYVVEHVKKYLEH